MPAVPHHFDDVGRRVPSPDYHDSSMQCEVRDTVANYEFTLSLACHFVHKAHQSVTLSFLYFESWFPAKNKPT